MPSSIGTITAVAQSVSLTPIVDTSLMVVLSGTYAGIEVVFEGTRDGTNYFPVGLKSLESGNVTTSSKLLTNTILSFSLDLGYVSLNISTFRVRSVSYTSGTLNVAIYGSSPFAANAATTGPDRGIQLAGIDGSGNFRFIQTANSLPASNAYALDVREVQQGQQTMAASRPVVLASNQSAIPVTISTTTSSQPVGGVPFSNDFKLFDFKFLGQDNTLLWYQTLSGSASAAYGSPNVLNMTCTTASGDSVVRQTQRIMGAGGVSMIYQVEATIGGIKTNVRQRAGAFDANDGVFFEQDGSNLKVVWRTSVSGSPVDTAINQSAWNVDKLDGTGPSGITLNTSYSNVYFATVNYGYIQFGIVDDGNAYYCHRVPAPNVAANTQFSTRNFPIRVEITNTGVAASTTTLALHGASAFASNGTAPFGIVRSIDLGATGKTVGGSITPLISIRLKSTNVRNQIVPQAVSLLLSSSQVVYFGFMFNASLTGASWLAVPGTGSISEYDISATALSGGTNIFSSYTSGTGQGGATAASPVDVSSLLKVSSDIGGTSDTLTLFGQKSGGTSPTGYATILFRELV